MRKKLFLAAAILLTIIGFSACKKETEENKPLRSRMIGTWKVDKIDVTTYPSSGTPQTVSTNYGTSDYFEFRDNKDDDVELRLNGSTTTGSFAAAETGKFIVDFAIKNMECDVIIINDKQFQFTATVTGANPKVTETYYLTR